MKQETVIKRILNYMLKHYPALEDGLKMQFIELIYLTYQNFCLDAGFDDMTDTEKLNYSIEISTEDEFRAIKHEYETVLSESEKEELRETYKKLLNNEEIKI